MMNEIKVEQQLVFNDRPAEYIIEHDLKPRNNIIEEILNNCIIRTRNVKTNESTFIRLLKEKEIKFFREERLNALKKHEQALRNSELARQHYLSQEIGTSVK